MIEFQFASFLAFLHMDPHGWYVWPTYGLGVLVIGGLTWQMAAGHRAVIKKIRRQIEREELHESET
jgi:heme exporter protein D